MHIICKKKNFVIDPFNYPMPTNSNNRRFAISCVNISKVDVDSELHNRIHPNV